MPLVNLNTLLQFIGERRSVAPAFNTTNLETTLAIMEAIDETGFPGIVQIAPTNLRLSGYEFIGQIARLSARRTKTPISLHLDHGRTMEDIESAVRAGFNSVMIDGSALPFEENIKLTKEAVDYCRCFGVPVEAELGAIGGKEDDASARGNATDPKEAREFVRRTGCDLLAVSVGNVHGLEENAALDLQLLEKIQQSAPVPLVLHGGSGLPGEILRKIRRLGVVKLNIASDLRRAYISAVGQCYQTNENEHNLVRVLMMAKEAVKKTASRKIRAMNA